MKKLAPPLFALILSTLPAFSQTWTGDTTKWILTNPTAPEVKPSPPGYTYINNNGTYGTDYTITAQFTQLAADGAMYGLTLETIGTAAKVEVVLSGLNSLYIRKFPGALVMAWAALPQTLNVATNLRVVATDDRIQVFNGATKLADAIGTGTPTGKTGLVSYGVQARASFTGTAWGTPPISEKECQDVRAVESGTNAWWFPGAGQSIALPLKVRDAAVDPRTLTAQYTLTHGGTTTISSGAVDFTPSLPRSWTSKIINITTGTENLYWLNVKNAATPAVLYGNWPVARHATPTANTLPASTFAIGAWYKDMPTILPALDFVARKTYMHAIGHAALRDGFNTIWAAVISSPQELDVLQRYGVSAGILPWLLNAKTNPAVMLHPAAFGYVVGDEPTDASVPYYATEYAKIYSGAYGWVYDGRPVLTTMIADDGATRDYHKLWRDIGAQHRMFRHYPFRKNPYDLLSPARYKSHLGVDGINWMNAGLTTPWYYVPQTFGWGARNAQSFYRPTTGPEVAATLWLAAAHGAKGYFCYTYQGYYPDYENPLVDGLTLLPTSSLGETSQLNEDRLAAVRAVNQKIKAWAQMPSTTIGQPSLPARITVGANACPKELEVRQLGDDTLAFINLDTKNAITYVGASDVSQNTTLQNTAGWGATWNGSSVTIQPGGIAFATTSNPGLWRPASTTYFQTLCQSLINAVTPTTGTWPGEVYNVNVLGDSHEWFRTPRYSADGEFSPLTALRLMELHKPGLAGQPDTWKMRWGSTMNPSLTVWMHRMAQVAYGHSARSAHDGNNVTVKFGPWTANNTPPTPHASSNFDPTDFVANGVFYGFDVAPDNLNILLLSRTWNSRAFTMAINLSTTSQNMKMTSHNYFAPFYTKIYDVYTGTSSMTNLTVTVFSSTTTQSSGAVVVNPNNREVATPILTIPANNMRVFEWKQ